MRRLLLKNVVMPLASTVTPFKSWAYMNEMCAADFEPLQRQRMHRMHLVRQLLVHVYREVDLYRIALDRAGVDPIEVSYPRSFARVPITSKDDLRNGFPDRQLARSYRGKALRYSNTSGTTGRPLLLIQDTRDISYKYASILRSRSLAGVDPLSSQVRLTPNECQPCLPEGDSPQDMWPLTKDRSSPGRRSAFFVFLERKVVNPLFHRREMLQPFWEGGSNGGPVDYDAYLERINQAEPEVLSIYPLYALLLAKHLRRTGAQPPKIKKLIDFSAGLAPTQVTEFIRETFGVPTAQSCGGCEFARYAASCPEDPNRMHLAESYVYVETVRSDGTLCAAGELGNVITTSLHSWAMPIVRLEPGDVARIISEPCTCGRRSRRIEHHGRIQAVMRTADGRWASARDAWEALLFIKGVELFQLIQHSEKKYTLRVLPEPDVTLDKTAMRAALAELLGKEAKVTTEMVETIAPESSGKLQLVKSATYEDFRPQTVRNQRVPVN
ncbi:MAG: phenylacetate-CoA ligase [Myxococcota bacterium]|jgi:phenylacetate-CoA ligase